LKTGLVVQRDDKLLDNYRGRIIFPVHNQSGKVMGFGARVIKTNDKSPKYINTPENEIYIKSRILYGMYFARTVIDKEDECLLVEGYTDVISLHQAGVENVVASGGTSLTIDQLRLIRKFTNNLTILYDGDAAGVKAALRGLDLAIEEGLHVKLVLLPEGEDPDSFVNNSGTAAFRDYIKAHKKDFILFQLEVSLREAGNDSSAKAAIVNQMAESLARMNKPEDFTRRNDYIRQVAEILKIDEQGFHTLISKFVRDKAFKDQQRSEKQDFSSLTEIPTSAHAEESMELVQNDTRHERAMVRCLLEFGLQPITETETVAEYLLREIRENELDGMMQDRLLLRIIDQYTQWYREGQAPTPKHFLYHDDQELSRFVIELMEVKEEISENWKDYYQGEILTRADLYREEVMSSITYLKLRKLKGLIEENQRELSQTTDPDEQLLCLKAGMHLKELERELTRLFGTVIYK
jgi:DNA primase